VGNFQHKIAKENKTQSMIMMVSVLITNKEKDTGFNNFQIHSSISPLSHLLRGFSL
jgi:hypothetical protein